MECLPPPGKETHPTEKRTPPPSIEKRSPLPRNRYKKKIQILHFINICVLLVKQHGQKLAVILQKSQFSLGACKISKNTRSVEKYYIT